MKKIIYIATRQPAYSRVSIIRQGLHNHFCVDEILSNQKSYPLRLAIVLSQLIWAWISGRLRRADAIFVGFFAQPIFPLVRLLYRGPIIADAYFSIYDTLVNDKQRAKSRSIIGGICFWLDKHMLQNADLCFTDTHQHVEYLKTTFSAKHANVRRLWISAENGPLDNQPSFDSSDEPFQIFFWGGFIPLQGVETIVRAAALLKPDNIRFTIFGNGQTYHDCYELRNTLGITNIEFAGWKSSIEIQRQAAHSHVALGVFGTTEKAARVIPNKVYEALAMGIPLITRQSQAVEELLTGDHNVLLVPEGNAQSLADKIRWTRDNYERALEIAKRGQTVFGEMASPTKISERLCETIRPMLSTHKTRYLELTGPHPAFSRHAGILPKEDGKTAGNR